MLGGNRAAHLRDDGVDDGICLVPARQKGLLVGADRLRDVVVNVAVAQMAEGHRPGARHGLRNGCARRGDEVRHARDGHRDIVLDRAAFQLLHVGHQFAQAPEISGLLERACQRGVFDQAVAQCHLKQAQQARASFRLRGELDQHIPVMCRGQRLACLGAMFQRIVDADAWHELKSLHVSAGHCLRQLEEIERALRACQADEGRLRAARARVELQHGGGDDAQRALRAHEQMLQVVAGVVLLQLGQIVQHAPVGQHHFETLHEIARIAIGEHGGAAGIGRQIAADGAGALRRQ